MRRCILNPLSAGTPGASLKKLREGGGIEIGELARVYAGGVPVWRIVEIEAADWVRGNSARAYRFAVVGILAVRSHASKP